MIGYLAYPTWLRPVLAPAVPIRWFTLLHLAAYLIVFLLFIRHLQTRGGSEELPEARSFFFWFIIAYLVGSRLGAVVLFGQFDEVVRRPWLLVWPVEEGAGLVGLRGMSFAGGLIGAGVALLAYHWKNRVRILLWADALVLGIPLMFALVRLGNFANQELYGRVTSLPWGIIFPEAQPVPASAEGVYRRVIALGVPAIGDAGFINLPRHPSQLYEALVTGLGAWMTLMLRRRRQPPTGIMTALYLMIYGAAQFLAGYLRIPPIRSPFVLRHSPQQRAPDVFTSLFDVTADQIASLVILAAGVAVLVAVRRYHAGRPGIETFHHG
jgi:phosphatidylglycerol---prolipoprotein diacylglyceryl transferase